MVFLRRRLTPVLEQAEAQIYKQFGANVSFQKAARTFRVIGARSNLGTTDAQIANLPQAKETYLTTNDIDTVSSSSASDTAVVLTISYLTISGGVFTPGVQTVTLNGQNKVLLDVPCARIETVFNLGTVAAIGDVYIYEDDTITAGVPDTDALVHDRIDPLFQRNAKGSITVPDNEFCVVTNVLASVLKKQAASVDVHAEFRTPPGTVFNRGIPLGLDTVGTNFIHLTLDPPEILPPNSDNRFSAQSSVAGTEVSLSLRGYASAVR
jgi:hypothetical protein